MSLLFQKIDDVTRGDHYYLSENDACYFLGEYTAHSGYKHSDTNNLISNLKKPMDRKGLPEWGWKEKAIRRCAMHLTEVIGKSKWIREATLVPIPPSYAKGDPQYDDRIVRILREIRASQPVDVRELIVQRRARDAAHMRLENRLPPEQHADNYRIDEALAKPGPKRIGIFDDVLVTGSQFKACQTVLTERFPGVPILGIFIARRTIAQDDEEFGD